eukprot:12392630-Ditylum_brightwellii.AAC.1
MKNLYDVNFDLSASKCCIGLDRLICDTFIKLFSRPQMLSLLQLLPHPLEMVMITETLITSLTRVPLPMLPNQV